MSNEDEKKYATQEQIAYLFMRTMADVEIFVRKEGLPYIRRSQRQYQFDLGQAIHWLIERDRRLLEEVKAKYNIRSLNEIALLFKKEPRWINRLSKEKGLPKDARGAYDLIKVIHWLVDEHEKELKEARRGGETEGQARKRLYAAQASMKELELTRIHGKLIHIDDVLKILVVALKALRDKILSLPKRAAPQIIALQNIAEIEELLETLINELLDDLSTLPDKLKRAGKLFASNPAGSISDTQATTKINGEPMGRSKQNS